MATASRFSSRQVTVMGAVAVLLLAAVVFLIGRDDTSSNGSGADPEVVVVASDTRHRFAELGELVAATDLVVSGRVVAVERGRTFGAVDDEGNAGANAIRSNVVTVEVRDVIAAGSAVASPAAGTVVLVEEEATLLDGTPIAVDGARATKVGDAGIWFLSASTDPEFPGFTVVNSQGRYLLADAGGRRAFTGAVRGADRTDALVRRLEALGFAGLVTETRTAATAPAAR